MTQLSVESSLKLIPHRAMLQCILGQITLKYFLANREKLFSFLFSSINRILNCFTLRLLCSAIKEERTEYKTESSLEARIINYFMILEMLLFSLLVSIHFCCLSVYEKSMLLVLFIPVVIYF